MGAPRFAEVVVTLPVEGRFHYLVPAHLEGALAVGHRVVVPFGPRRVTGFVLGLTDEAPGELEGKLKAIIERVDPEPMLGEDLLGIVSFAARYYLAPAGEVLRVALPPGLTAGSVRKLKITGAGRAAVIHGAPGLSAKERALLVKLSGGRAVPAGKIDAERLIANGLVERVEKLAPKKADQGVEVVELVPGAPALRSRARVQKAVVELLAAGPMTVDDLATRIDREALLRAIRALEGKDRVRRVVVSTPVQAVLPPPGVPAPVLSADQAAALAPILGALREGRRESFLLRGVTGSGKTEVYLHAIAEARKLGKTAIVLVPEIALTAQLESRFRARFGDDVVVLHSALTDLERRQGWHRLRSGGAGIALGPRSAVWAPVRDLGVVVVDEEHDPSFKQNTELRYHGRDLAILRAHRAGGVAILGSATPALETRLMAKSGRLTELRLAGRIAGRPMPAVETIDLREALKEIKGGEVPILSRTLADALRAAVDRKEQAILFLNRRGFNTVVICDDCGAPRKCRSCDVSLTHHKAEAALVCHYCGHHEPLLAPCKECGGRPMKPFGAGTERVAEAVKDAAPDARVARLDRDVTAKAGALDETLEAFRAGELDVLVGTQMVAKGHDFPGVTLVGIVCADTSLAFPDFRAAERTFQLVTQVAGRAGRASLPGRVIVQTFQPEHYAIVCALAHDDDRFFEIESASRQRSAYPPFSRIGLVRVESEDEPLCLKTSREVAALAHRAGGKGEVRVLGPELAPLGKIKNKVRRRVMLMAPTPSQVVAAMSFVRANLPRPSRRVDVIFDVDPTDML